MKNNLLEKVKGGSPISRQSAYAKAAAYFDTALDTLIYLMSNAKQESVRASAANKIIDKVLPDLKASEVELSGVKDKPIELSFSDEQLSRLIN